VIWQRSKAGVYTPPGVGVDFDFTKDSENDEKYWDFDDGSTLRTDEEQLIQAAPAVAPWESEEHRDSIYVYY